MEPQGCGIQHTPVISRVVVLGLEKIMARVVHSRGVVYDVQGDIYTVLAIEVPHTHPGNFAETRKIPYWYERAPPET